MLCQAILILYTIENHVAIKRNNQGQGHSNKREIFQSFREIRAVKIMHGFQAYFSLLESFIITLSQL